MMEIDTGDDSFETFFNNEALSDRVLVVTEVAKVYPISTSPSGRSYLGNKRPFPHNCCNAGEHTECPSNKRVSLQKQNSNDNSDQDNVGVSSAVEMAQQAVEMAQQAVEMAQQADDEASQLNDEIEQLHVMEEQNQNNNVEILADNEQMNEQPIHEQQDDNAVLMHEPVLTQHIKSDENEAEDDRNIVRDQSSGNDSTDVQTQLKEHNEINIQIVIPKIEFEKDLPSCSHSHIHPPNDQKEHEIIITPNPEPNVTTPTTPPTIPTTNTIPKQAKDEMVVSETKVTKETKVYVHSVILAAKSDFFKLLFATSGMRETKQKEVKVEIGQGQTKSMLILLHCFYYKNFINSQDLQTVLDVCALAMQYCYDGLIEKCLDIFRCRAENVTEVHDINQIALMVSKIQSELQQHKEKCTRVMKTCGPFLMNSFYPIDELLEKSPEKFYQLHLNSMYLLLDRSVQERFNQDCGNLFIYAMQKWLRAHLPNILSNDQFKIDVIRFIEKLLSVIELRYITGAFLTNVMAFEHSPLALWDGYKDWYIRSLQKFVYEYTTNKRHDSRSDQPYPVLKRRRLSKFVRKEKNADIFSLASPIILNGFEIGVYLRIREDRKIHLICKCKNLVVNKTGFDQCELQFRIRGTIKINIDQNIWFEHFPQPHSHWVNDWFGFSYKQGGMCLQMYSVCRLPESVYELAKKFGFSLAIQIQQLK